MNEYEYNFLVSYKNKLYTIKKCIENLGEYDLELLYVFYDYASINQKEIIELELIKRIINGKY